MKSTIRTDHSSKTTVVDTDEPLERLHQASARRPDDVMNLPRIVIGHSAHRYNGFSMNKLIFAVAIALHLVSSRFSPHAQTRQHQSPRDSELRHRRRHPRRHAAAFPRRELRHRIDRSERRTATSASTKPKPAISAPSSSPSGSSPRPTRATSPATRSISSIPFTSKRPVIPIA